MTDDNNQDHVRLAKIKLIQGVASLVIGLLLNMNPDVVAESFGFDVSYIPIVSYVLVVGGVCIIIQGLYKYYEESGHKASNETEPPQDNDETELPPPTIEWYSYRYGYTYDTSAQIVLFRGGACLVVALICGLDGHSAAEAFDLHVFWIWIFAAIMVYLGYQDVTQSLSWIRKDKRK